MARACLSAPALPGRTSGLEDANISYKTALYGYTASVWRKSAPASRRPPGRHFRLQATKEASPTSCRGSTTARGSLLRRFVILVWSTVSPSPTTAARGPRASNSSPGRRSSQHLPRPGRQGQRSARLRLEVKACAVVDSDLCYITGDWIKYLLEPVLKKGTSTWPRSASATSTDGHHHPQHQHRLIPPAPFTAGAYASTLDGGFAFSRDLAGTTTGSRVGIPK
jgi:hypothetical protein